MGFCYELNTGCCGVPIANCVNVAFCHFVIHGIFVTSFVFSNTCYPTFYYVDNMFGISGGVLILVSILGIFFASLKTCQPLRSMWAIVVLLNVSHIMVASIMYAYGRWDDVVTTAFTRAIRSPLDQDYPDYLWYTLTVIACFMIPIFFFYLIYIISFMCNKWQSHLFTYNYDPSDLPYFSGHYPRQITVPTTPRSDAYPVQKNQ